MGPTGSRSAVRLPPSLRNPQRGPQFASTPRFLLSQLSPEFSYHQNEEIDDIYADEPLPFSTPLPAARAPTKLTARNVKGKEQARVPNHDEAIEDSNDEAYCPSAKPAEASTSTKRIREGSISDATTPGSTDGSEAERQISPTELDIEFDIFFGTTRDRPKRRRISLQNDTETPQLARGEKPREADPIVSSSQESDHVVGNQAVWLASPDSSPETLGDTHWRTLAAALRTTTTTTTTPGHAIDPPGEREMRTPFREPPRFVLSGNPLSSLSERTINRIGTHSSATAARQSHSTPRPFPPSATIMSFTSAPTTTRRKPNFVLPRSPSPSTAAEDPDASFIPVPFSPSSRTLHRKGRARSTAPAYLPGGMAADVRGWVLETAAKRTQQQQQQQQQQHQSHHITALLTVSAPLETYLRVVDVRCTALSSAGPLVFIHAVPVRSNPDEANSHLPSKNALLLGAPRTNVRAHASSGLVSLATTARAHIGPELEPPDSVTPGRLVGIHPPLVWEVDLEDFGAKKVRAAGREPMAAGSGCSGSARQSAGKLRWLVAMEWDLLG